MTDSTALGDRMKRYEHSYRLTFPRRLPVVIRVDGRAFHSHLRGAAKPFDMQFIEDMGHVAVALCEEISGAVFAYHQSDEVSVLVQDWVGEHAEPWFAGELQKIVSLSAAIATAALGERRPGRPLFDARAQAPRNAPSPSVGSPTKSRMRPGSSAPSTAWPASSLANSTTSPQRPSPPKTGTP